MTDSIVNHVVSVPPSPGHRLSVARLTGSRSVPLTEVYAAAGRLATRLRQRGIGPGDRIGILAGNSLEWVLLDLAALRLKVVTAGLEPGKFAADPALLARYDLTLLYADQPAAAGAGIRPIAEIEELAAAPGPDPGAPDAGPDPGAADPGPDAVGYAAGDVTTIKFTSGSTGEPKGLAATVGSIDASLRAVQDMFGHGPGDDLFIFLPLSLLQQRYWIYSALRYGHDVTVSTYEAAFAALPGTRPTVVMGVPGFYETAKKHIEARVRRTGSTVAAAARDLFGDRIRYLWTGSAPANPSTLRFFTEAGLPIYEGYGLNETCIVSKNHPGAWREGSVGRVLPGKRVLFGPDGRISIHSDTPVNTRYEYAAPGESERVFGPDGTVRTSDIGYLDEDGFLFIQGRADDVIVLDNGRKIITRPIEEYLKRSPAIEECVVLCPAQTYLVAVVSPASEPADEAAIAAHLAACNVILAKDERIDRLVIAHPRFTVENGLLTSQFKPRRALILDTYRSEITAPREGIHAH